VQQRSSSSTAAVVLLGTFSRPFWSGARSGGNGTRVALAVWHPAGGPLSPGIGIELAGRCGQSGKGTKGSFGIRGLDLVHDVMLVSGHVV